MRRLSFISAILLLVIAGCDGIKVTKPMLRMIVSGSNKVSTAPTFADSLDKRIGVPYVSDGTPSQVLDIYYADKAVRRDAVLIDIHGGFYVAGKRQNSRGFASFADGDGFTKEALAWFIGPRYEDKAYLESLSPRTFVGSYAGPLFVSTCKNDFIRGQALMLKQDCDSIGRKIEFLDIPADDKKVGHVHNVINQELPESNTVKAVCWNL